MKSIYLTTVISLSLAIVDIVSSQCPSIYKRYCASHSFCLPKNESCAIIAYKPTLVEQQLIVDLHNTFRRKVAFGTNGFSQASNMMEMEWDDELSAVAQNYADQCLYKHDHSNCRQVSNFNVGQNLAIQMIQGTQVVPSPDWHFAVKAWYDEIAYISKDDLENFQAPKPGVKEYRHFSQVAWASTYRVGCGFVIYKTGQAVVDLAFYRLYVCNYGPTGNVYDEPVYTRGVPCSNCPVNSCCGKACISGDITSGLCSRSDKDAPYYPPPPNLFHCSFSLARGDCKNERDENSNWEIQSTLGGNQLSIVLNGGESSTIKFDKTIIPTGSDFCITLQYRKGPNIDGHEEENTATEVLFVPSNQYKHSQPLKSYPSPERHQFSLYNLTLGWSDPTELSLEFSVPNGASAQYFNVDSILVTDGKCQNIGQ